MKEGSINCVRLNILMKGYACQTDVQRFLKIGSDNAKEIYQNLVKEAELEGKVVMLGIDPTRLLKYIHMTKNDVIKYAELEKKDAHFLTGTEAS